MIKEYETRKEPQMQLYLCYISGICGGLKPVLEHIRSGALGQLFIENQECLEGNKPFSNRSGQVLRNRLVFH